MIILSVVYHLVPTSNHNVIVFVYLIVMLFIILFLHQTTTQAISSASQAQLFIILFLHQTTTLKIRHRPKRPLFIILFLHQTTTYNKGHILPTVLFIILFLHQTTTNGCPFVNGSGCLSSCSYIKPQQLHSVTSEQTVVYHLVPTSNHNLKILKDSTSVVVYHLVPTSNHNPPSAAPE